MITRQPKQDINTFLKILTKDQIIKDETLRSMAEIRALISSVKLLSEKVDNEIETNRKSREEMIVRMDNEKRTMENFKNRIIKELQEVANEVLKMQKGDPGKDADEASMVQKVLGSISLPDEKTIIENLTKKLPKSDELEKKLIAKIPKEIDPLAIIDLIMKLPKGKKLKTEHIDGLDQTIRAFQHQLGRGYLHGGGISANNMVHGEVVSGSGTAWTLASNPLSGTVRLYAVGQRLPLTTKYSISGQTITTVDSWSAGDLLADYIKQ